MKKILYLLILAFALVDCSSVPVTGRKQLSLVSDQEVLTMSFQQYNDYIKKAPLSTDASSTQMVVRVGKRIANAVETYLKTHGYEKEVANYQWEFHLVKDNTPNAFCMPGGKIVVYEGILPYTKNEDGLATVMGHEVAHAVAKHSNEQISQQMLIGVGGQVLDVATSDRSDLARAAINTAYGLGAQVGVMLPYSRKHEYEADHLGLIFMTMAGYNPNEAITFWQRMAGDSSGGSDFLSTHPSDTKRIEEIRKYIPEALKYAPGRSTTQSTTTKDGFRLVY